MTTHSQQRSLPLVTRFSSGFTLLEVMVVIVLVGIVLSAVTLSVGGQREQQLQTEIRRIQQVMKLAHEEAMLNQSELAIQFRPHDYQFQLFTNNTWQAIDEPNYLRQHLLDDGFDLKLLQDGIAVSLTEDEAGRVLLSSSGEMTPFELILSLADSELRYQLSGTPMGELIIRHSGDS